MKSIATALACLALACGASEPEAPSTRLLIAPEVAGEALAAVEAWQDAIGYDPEVIISDTCEGAANTRVWCIASAPASEIPCMAEGEHCLGSTVGSHGGVALVMPLGLPGPEMELRPPGHVYVRNDLPSRDDAVGVLIHEIGHTLAVDHLPAGVMKARRSVAELRASAHAPIDSEAVGAAIAAGVEP